jgi:hypothetical protein
MIFLELLDSAKKKGQLSVERNNSIEIQPTQCWEIPIPMTNTPGAGKVLRRLRVCFPVSQRNTELFFEGPNVR